MSELPDTWTAATLADVSYLNPGWDNALEDDTIISFVPMSAAEAGTGRLDVSATRSVRESRAAEDHNIAGALPPFGSG